MEENNINRLDILEDEKEMITELRKLGYQIDSVYDLINNKSHDVLDNKFEGSYKKAYPILVKHLNIPHNSKVREGIVRALTEKDASQFAKVPLLDAFYKETDKFVKWSIANALRCFMPKTERDKYPEIDIVFNNINTV